MTDTVGTFVAQSARPKRTLISPPRVARALLLPLLIVLGWQAAGSFGISDPTLLPTPLQVLTELVRLTVTGELFSNLGVSFRRVVLGFAFGTSVAVLLGALTGYSLYWRGLIDPTVHALRTIPGLAWIPMSAARMRAGGASGSG